MLTERETEWLEYRDAIQFATGWYVAGFYPEMLDDDYQDAAEFEARVVVKIITQERCPLPNGAQMDGCPYFNDDDVSSFSCSWCAVKRSRISVEEEMNQSTRRRQTNTGKHT